MDSVQTALLGHAFAAAAEEMGVNLYRSARSTVIREVRDMATGILDPSARTIAGSSYVAMLLGAIDPAAKRLAEMYDFCSLGPDEVLIFNDPFHGGQHLNDIFVFVPVHHGGQVVAITCSAAHHPDLGGGKPGATDNSEVFGEGLLIPGVRVRWDDGWQNGTFGRMLLSNVRTPHVCKLDLEAQIAAGRLAAKRIQELAQKYGSDELFAFYDRAIDYSKTVVECALASVPDGTYSGSAEVEDDGRGQGPFTVKVELKVQGTRVAVDFAGTDQQATGYINAPWGATVAAVQVTLLSILGCAHRLVNSGAYLPISIVAPYGSLVNPVRPAATRARTQVSLRIMEAISNALAEVLPDRIPACGFNSQTSVTFIRQEDHRYAILTEVLGGGWGATATRDGASGMGSLLTNALNTPIEAVEAEFPFVRVRTYGYFERSGGTGRHRGGDGMERSYEVVQNGVTFSHTSERNKTGAPGAYGGEDGTPGACILIREGVGHVLGSKGTHDLNRGDVVIMRTGGGGGYGPTVRSRTSSG